MGKASWLLYNLRVWRTNGEHKYEFTTPLASMSQCNKLNVPLQLRHYSNSLQAKKNQKHDPLNIPILKTWKLHAVKMPGTTNLLKLHIVNFACSTVNRCLLVIRTKCLYHVVYPSNCLLTFIIRFCFDKYWIIFFFLSIFITFTNI